MSEASIAVPDEEPKLILPILVGGAVAGTLDLITAFISYGPNVPRAIAAGLLGRQVMHGGVAIWILGVFLHYFIAFSAATVYCLAARKLMMLKDHFVVCGIFYGIGFFLVMNLVVLPLSALHATGPYQLHGLIQGLLVHMFIIGLPISTSLRMLSDQRIR
jgi:hypothetical protein